VQDYSSTCTVLVFKKSKNTTATKNAT